MYASAQEEPDHVAAQPIWLPPATLDPITEAERHMLLWLARGEAEFIVAGQPYRLSAGSAIWVPVHTEHSFTTRPNAVVIPVLFPTAEIATTLRQPTVIRVDRDLRTLLLASVQSLFVAIERNVNITRQILALIEDNPAFVAALPLPSGEAARKVAEALIFNPGDDRSVAALARTAHASVSKIERAFLAETGMTLRQWRVRNRMETAGILLRSPTSVTSVAHRVGYTNTSAFYRAFKGHFGLTPGEYIARYRSR